MERLTRAKENHDEEAVDKAFKAMEDALTGEEEHSTNLSELLDLLELRRKTLEAETRRLTNSESTLNLEQNLTLIGFLQNAVKEPIYAHTPPDVAKRILKKSPRVSVEWWAYQMMDALDPPQRLLTEGKPGLFRLAGMAADLLFALLSTWRLRPFVCVLSY